MLRDLLNLGRLPSMITSDQLGKFDLVLDGQGGPGNTEEWLPLRAQMIDDIPNAPVSDANHYYVLTICYRAPMSLECSQKLYETQHDVYLSSVKRESMYLLHQTPSTILRKAR
jgi:hypothetical protein